MQRLEAPSKNLAHPHEVHDIQTEAANNPGNSGTQGHPADSLQAKHEVHAAIVDGHDHNPHQEERDCH